MSLRGALEDRVIELLSPLRVEANGGYLRAIRPYNGLSAPERIDQEFLRVLQGETPSVLVATGDGVYDRFSSGRQATLTGTLELLITSRNLRSGEARTRGDGGLSTDPGIYQIIEDIWQRLYRRDLEIKGFNTLKPLNDLQVTIAPDLTNWQLIFEFQALVCLPPISDEAGDYTSIHNEMNFPSDDDGEPANPVLEFDIPLEVP